MKIVNTTEHEICLIIDEKNKKYFYPCNLKIKLSEEYEIIDKVYDIPIYSRKFKSINLPKEEEGTYYLVSGYVQDAYPERKDLLVPADFVRDENGRIIGCRKLVRKA